VNEYPAWMLTREGKALKENLDNAAQRGNSMKEEAVNHPAHYQSASGIEVIDFIEAYELNFAIGSVVKYVARAGKKAKETEIEDLEKARWYLDREISRLRKKETT